MRLVQICVLNTFLIGLLLLVLQPVHGCQTVCTCTMVPASDAESTEADGDDDNDDDIALPSASKGRKVNCSNNPYMYSFSSMDDINKAINIPLDTIYLDLSKNKITLLRKASFSSLSELQRLDLSSNMITLIEPGTFDGLSHLDKLDLSHNKLGSINSSLFSGLPNLKKLNLSFNKLNTIPDGTFNNLPLLRRLEFQSDYLRCDCHLQWIIKWSKDRKVKIKATTTCAVPSELNGESLRKLKKKDLHCERPLELPLFEIKPGINQIVFEGDKIPFECQASVVDPNTTMYWLRDGKEVVPDREAGIFTTSTYKSPDSTVMTRSLVLEDLKPVNEGKWLCLVSTPQGNVTKTVTLVVLDSDAPQCEKNTTKTNKGVYIWKETVAGVTKELPCKLGEGKVTHKCDRFGKWTDFNHSTCAFTNEYTRKLQTIAQEKNTSSIRADAKLLEKVVVALFQEEEGMMLSLTPEYIELVAQAVYRLSQNALDDEEIVKTVLFCGSKIMNVSSDILGEAQRTSKALTRISQAVETVSKHAKDKSTQSSPFIVIETRTFLRKDFPGIQCTRLDLKLDLTLSRMVQTPTGFVFVCDTPQNTTAGRYSSLKVADPRTSAQRSQTLSDQPKAQALVHPSPNEGYLTSILVPRSVLHRPSTINPNITTLPPPADSTVRFQFIWYKNANLFLAPTKRREDPILRGKNWNVISSVLSISLSEPVSNLTEPIRLTFEIPETDKELIPAYWDYSANYGYGDWRTDGCNLVERSTSLVIVHCDHLTSFAILEGESVAIPRMFQMMQIVVYIGSCICLLCLMAIIITYVSCFRFLNIPRKMKHSVINICISLLLLIIGFTMGVKRTDHERACQIVGIVLHYLSMVTMFWFTVTSSNLMKKFRKTEKPPPPPMDYPMPLPPKPIIRFYLLAWGVPSIICGITAAISFEFYMKPNAYCYLQWDPGLGAFIGPIGFLLLLNIAFFLRTQCIIDSSTGPLLRLESTQELPITDIEMTTNHDRIETQSMMSGMSGKSTVSSVMDYERRPITQLRALAFCLVLFMLTWVFGAITVAQPFSVIPYQELIFSYLYGVFCAILGIFMLIYFCLARKDSRTSWKRFFFCEQQVAVYVDNHITVETEPQANGHVNTGSGMDVSKVSSTIVTNHVNSVKKSDDEMSSINLVPSKPPSLIDSSLNNSAHEVTAASFYNPRQNGVAKKFWEKKNKHNSKLISKDMTKSLNFNGTDTDFSGSEIQAGGPGYLSDSSKPGLSLDCTIKTGGGESEATRSPIHQQSPPSYSTTMANDYFTAAIRTSSPQSGHTDHVGGSVMDSGRLANPHQRVASPQQRVASPQQRMASPQQRVASPQRIASPFTPVQLAPQHPPQHTRTNSSSSLGVRNHASAFSVVPPRNNTLPKQGKFMSHSMPSSPEREIPQQTISVPSSVARTGDFDGSSQVSSSFSHEYARSPRPGDVQYIPGYTSPVDGSVYKQYGLIDGQPVMSPQHRHRTNSEGYSSGGDSNRLRKKMENNFIQQVEQRIPQGVGMNQPIHQPNQVNNNNHIIGKHGRGYNGMNHVAHKPPKSPISDSDNNGSRVTFPDSDSQLHCRKQVRYNDSDHNSEPASQSHKVGRSRDSHRHGKYRGMTKQRSLDWDKQFKDKTPANVAPYAYVNHNYNDRVLQKLTNMAITEQIDPKSKAFWVPRSSRSYNQLVMKEHARLCEDSTSSSSDDDDDSLDNIWVLRKKKRCKKDKKETSV